MTVMYLIGSVLVAFCVPCALFVLLISTRAQLFITMFSSAFFWLAALLLSSLIYAIIPQLSSVANGFIMVLIAVLFIEVARIVFIRLFFTAERSFAVVSINAIVFPMVDLYSAIASGVGFGATHTFFYYAPILAYSDGRGSLFSPHCTHYSTFTLSAWSAFLYNILHVALFVIAFDALRTGNMRNLWAMGSLHLVAATMSFLNTIDGGCLYSLPLLGVVIVLASLLAIRMAHTPYYRSLKRRG